MIVLWRTTTSCNYACGFCAYDRRLRGPRHEITEADAVRFGDLLVKWSHARDVPVLLSWLGGEPLLWRPLWSLSSHLSRAGLRLSATTNGSTLHHPEVQAAVLASFAELTVSVDGPEDIHDRLRGRVGAWRRVRAGIAVLAEARPSGTLKLRANVVLMRETIEHFAELCMELAAWGIDEITFNQLGGRDRPTFFPAQRLLPTDVARFAAALPALRERLASDGVTLCGDDRYVERLRASAAGAAIPITDCQPGSSFLFIDEHGIAAPCSFSTEDYGVPISSLRSIADLDTLPARFAAARRTRRLATCDDCPSTQAFAKFAA